MIIVPMHQARCKGTKMATTNTALHQVQRDIEERGLQQLALGMHRITAVRRKAISSRPDRQLVDKRTLNGIRHSTQDTFSLQTTDQDDQTETRKEPHLVKSYIRIAVASTMAACLMTLAGCGGGGDDAGQEASAPAWNAEIRAGLVGQPVGTLSPVSMAEAITQDVVISHRPGPPGTMATAAEAARLDCEQANKARLPCVIVSTSIDGQGAQIGKWLTADSMHATLCDLTRSTALELDTKRCAASAIDSATKRRRIR